MRVNVERNYRARWRYVDNFMYLHMSKKLRYNFATPLDLEKLQTELDMPRN